MKIEKKARSPRPEQGSGAIAGDTRKTPGEPSIADVAAPLRAEMKAAAAAGKPSDLATALLSTAFETGLAQLVHGHYALTGLGKAVKARAMPASDVEVLARDMVRNFRRLEAIYGDLGRQAALQGRVGGVFSRFGALAAGLALAADALATWCRQLDAEPAAATFTERLESARGAIVAFVAAAQESQGPTPR